ncbi:MAG: hypothetical protein DRO98_07865 [Archaeoglobales archaeon]|nr:MAG: hypothetical protein DRO98_07865 [Archaeoglobales archaeon]
MHLRYYSPSYNPRKHEKIISLLKAIEDRYSIRWEEVVVNSEEWYLKPIQLTEEEVYEYHLKPVSKLIRENSEILRSLGVKVLIETVTKKFKSISGHIYVAGTIAVVHEKVVWAGIWDEAVDFLKRLLSEGPQLLEVLKT